MRKLQIRAAWLATICATVMAIAGAAPAQGAAGDPLYLFIPQPTPPFAILPPTGYLNGPCGLAVDSTARIFVSDYYHHAIDVFNPTPTYVTQLANEDPTDGPCGLALDASNNLYVNNFHRNVVRFNPSPSFGAGTTITGAPLDSSRPTGVAVDPSTGYVYVNKRTYIAVYDSAGVPVPDGAEQLKIGLGTLGDGYGLALSRFPGTLGRLYVPDAATDTVKVYDPAADKVNPVATIKDPFNDPFASLRDSAVAVDRVSGDVYVADNTQPQYTEKPQATIYIFGPTGTYKGHLKYNVLDALPPGLAVDNSVGSTQGRVYVTSGNTDKAGIYAYAAGSGVFGPPLPPSQTLTVKTGGSGSGAVAGSAGGVDCPGACQAEVLSGAEVALTAEPSPGSEFAGWSGGGCDGTGVCAVEMDEAVSVSADFVAALAQAPGAQASTAAGPPSPPRAAPKKRHRGRRHKARRHHRRMR
jgi:DNA-binding beta-propeller fold protein YncE